MVDIEKRNKFTSVSQTLCNHLPRDKYCNYNNEKYKLFIIDNCDMITEGQFSEQFFRDLKYFTDNMIYLKIIITLNNS